MIRSSVASAALLLCLCSCGGDKIVEPVQDVPVAIKSGTFFGACTGYCLTETSINPSTISYVEWSYDSRKFPDRTRMVPITQQEWHRLVELARMDVLVKLDSVIGCPDCLNGGGEWIEVQSAGRTKRIVFERGAIIEPIKDLIGGLHEVQGRVKL